MIVKMLRKSFQSLFDLRVLFLMIVPFLIATLGLILCLILFWSTWSHFIVTTQFFQWISTIIGNNFLLNSVQFVLILIATFLVFGPLWYLTCILMISILFFPLLLPHLQKKFYPGLEKKKSISLLSSLRNIAKISALYLFLMILSLPVWIFPPMGAVIILISTAYLNKNIFFYDVLENYASPKELQDLKDKFHKSSWGLGLGTGLISWVPGLNTLAPALTSLLFIHFYLSALQVIRTTNQP